MLVKCCNMSLSSSSRFLDVRTLTTEEIIDLIKNDEYYSSCCKIIEERDLNGQDILNLTEKQILAWRTPQWLIRNLLSLKSSLRKNPEMFLHLEEDNTLINHNSNLINDTPKNASNKAATFLRPPDNKFLFKPKLPVENDAENKYLSLNVSQDESEYDENYYLKPSVINANAKITKGFGKPLPKLPGAMESNSIKITNVLSRTPSAFRNPIPSPREDIEENVYEPAPHSFPVMDTRPSSPFFSSMSVEADNEYEPPPILPHRFDKPFHQQEPPKFFFGNASNLESDKDPSHKLERHYINTEIKRKLSGQFLPPPLPVRTLTLNKLIKKENTKPSRRDYTNVTNNRYIDDDTTKKKSPVIDVNETVSRNYERKLSLKVEPTSKEVLKNQKSWGSERPLPPIPLIEIGKRRNSMSESRKNSNGSNTGQDEKVADEVLKYYSLRQTSFPKEILLRSGNNEDTAIPLKSDYIQALKSKQQSQTDGPSSNLSQLKPITRNHEVFKKENILISNAENNDNHSDFRKNDEARKSSILNSSNESKLNSNLLSEIHKVKLKSTKDTAQKDKTPHYKNNDNQVLQLTNTEEIKKSFKTNKFTKPPINPISSQLQVNLLVSETTEMKFKSPHNIIESKEENRVGDGFSAEYKNNEEAKKFEFNQNIEAILKNRSKKKNLPIPKAKLNPTRATLPNRDSYSDDDNLPEYINTVEKTKFYKSSPTTELTVETKLKYGTENDTISKQKSITGDSAGDDEILPEYINTEEAKGNLEINPTNDLILKTTILNSNKSGFTDLATQISSVKLKSTAHSVHKKQIALDEIMTGNNEILPEYINATESRISSKSYNYNKKIPRVGELKSNLEEEELKPTNPAFRRKEFLSNISNDENLPEYSNHEEIKKSAEQPLTTGSTMKTSQQTANQSPISQLTSEISKLKLNPTNSTLLLDDATAEILKRKLLEKGLTRKKNREDQEEKTRTLQSNSSEEYLDDTMDISLENSEEDHDVYDEYDDPYNFNNEKYFRNTDRKGAKSLLRDLEDGAFVLRPSREKKYFLSITVKSRKKYYNLGIMRTGNRNVFCGEGDMRSPEFPSIKTFLDYFEKVPFVFHGEKGTEHVYLKKILPNERF